jgi:hypothetical protein
MIDKAHMSQLYYYLSEKIRCGTVRYAMPLVPNAEQMLENLAYDDLEYESFQSPETDKFGILVCVGRGESVNGVKIGHYKISC